MIPHHYMGPIIEANKRESEAYAAVRKLDDIMVRVADRDFSTLEGWLTSSEVEAFGWTPHPDQTSEYHKGTVTFAEVMLGAVPWMRVIGRRPMDMTDVEKTAKRAWISAQGKTPHF